MPPTALSRRAAMCIKASKDGILRQVVPDYELLKDKYELLWEMPNNDGYLQLVGIMQKFIDQSISANTNYDPTFPVRKSADAAIAERLAHCL
jgi:ribonucleoside-diphosphate reductase alpha chain